MFDVLVVQAAAEAMMGPPVFLFGIVTILAATISTIIVNMLKRATTFIGKAPGPVKAIVALMVAQGLTFVAAATGMDMGTTLEGVGPTVIEGLVVWLGSMGVHGAWKAIQ